uniref:Uncharacterized protein n=1 Tax=Mola mola TaxID=94237 RepID=A0A3Q4AX21_MOLML
WLVNSACWSAERIPNDHLPPGGGVSCPPVGATSQATSNHNLMPVISMQTPSSPRLLPSTYHHPVVEARKSLSSLLETQMSLATSKPKSRSMYYGLIPSQYAAYGGIKTTMCPRGNDTSSHKRQPDVAVDGSLRTKSETKQLNGHQSLPSLVEVSAAHTLQPLSPPKDSKGIIICSKDVFEESQSEAHRIGAQSLQTSRVDTIKPELPPGLVQKTIQQSTSDVSTPKASYSEAPIPTPKAGEVHTQSAALNTIPCLKDSSGPTSSSSPLVKVSLNSEMQHSEKVTDIVEKDSKPVKTTAKRDSKVTNAKSGQLEIAPVQSACGVSPSTANGLNTQHNARPVDNPVNHKTLLDQTPGTQLELKYSGGAILHGACVAAKTQADKLVLEDVLLSKAATDTVLYKQKEDANQYIEPSSGFTLPNKTNMENIVPSIAANIEHIPDKNEPKFSNIFSKESTVTTSGSLLPHEHVTASVCSAQYNVCTVSAASQSTKITQQVSAEIEIGENGKTIKNQIHLPAGLALKSQTSSAPNMPVVKPTTEPKLSDPSITATKFPNISDIKLPLDVTSRVPIKETPKLIQTSESVVPKTRGSTESSGPDKVGHVASFYADAAKQASLNIPAKDTTLPKQDNLELKHPTYSNIDTNRDGNSAELHPQTTNRTGRLLTGKMPTEYLPSIPLREANNETKYEIEASSASSITKENILVDKRSTENKLSNELSTGLVTASKSSTDVFSPGQSDGVVAIQPGKHPETAQSNKPNLGSKVHSTADNKGPNRSHANAILPVMTDLAVSTRSCFGTVQVTKTTVPSSPIMRHVTPSPQLRSHRPESRSGTTPADDIKPSSGSCAQTKIYTKLNTLNGNLVAERRSSAQEITKETINLKEQSLRPLASPPTRTKDSVRSKTETASFSSFGNVAANKTIINQIRSGDNLQSCQTELKQFRQSVTMTKKSTETNTLIHTVNSQAISCAHLNNQTAANIHPFAETARDAKNSLSPSPVTVRGSPLPLPRRRNTPIRSYTPTPAQSSQSQMSLNHDRETKPSSVIMKDQTKPPSAPLQNNTPTSTIIPSAKSIKEESAKSEIKPVTTKDLSVLTNRTEVRVHSQTPKIQPNLSTTSSKEEKLSELNTGITPIESSDLVLPGKPTFQVQPPTMQVEPIPSSATVEIKPAVVENEASKSPPDPVRVSLHTNNDRLLTELPVESISPPKPATDRVMKPSLVKMAVIDSAPASLPQASVSVKAPSPHRGTSLSSHPKTGLKDRDVLRAKTTAAAPTEAPGVKPSTESMTSTASSTDKKTENAETTSSSAEPKDPNPLSSHHSCCVKVLHFYPFLMIKFDETQLHCQQKKVFKVKGHGSV